MNNKTEDVANEENVGECVWLSMAEGYGSVGVYQTCVNFDFEFIEDGVTENKFKFCPYCGKTICVSEQPEGDCPRMPESRGGAGSSPSR